MGGNKEYQVVREPAVVAAAEGWGQDCVYQLYTPQGLRVSIC